MRFISDSIFIIASLIVVLLWQQSRLGHLAPIIGLLGLIYCVSNIAKPRMKKISIFLLQSLVFLLIITTGGIDSYLFPLLYFLSFAIAFQYSPPMVFVFILTVLLLFMPEIHKFKDLQNIIKFASILLISPIAYFFSQELRLRIKEEKHQEEVQERAEIATEQITEDVMTLVEEKAQNLNQTDLERINDILQEIHELQKQTNQNEKN